MVRGVFRAQGKSEMELFAKTVNALKPLTVFVRNSILDI